MMELDPETRKELMIRMAGAGIPHARIGKVFDVSREMVCQIIGSASEYPSNGRAVLLDTEALVESFRRHGRVSDVSRELGVSPPAIKRALYEALGSELAVIRRDVRKREVAVRLRAFIDQGGTFSSIDLIRYDPSLYSLAVRIQKLGVWAEELGVGYTRYIQNPSVHESLTRLLAASDTIVDAYLNQGNPIWKIAAEYGVPPVSISTILHAKGIVPSRWKR